MRSRVMFRMLTVPILLCALVITSAQTGSRMSLQSSGPPKYWPIEKSQPLIDKTQTIKLAPDLSQLSASEREAVAKLLEVGKIFQTIYEDQRHKQALSSYRALLTLGRSYVSSAPAATENLVTLNRLFQGPIATTLENKREPFLPVDTVVPGKNMYPWGVKKEEIESFLSAHPEQRDEVMGLRTVVRTANSLNSDRDFAMLRKYPVLDTLHPGLRAELETISGVKAGARGARPLRTQGFYAVPYSVAYADDLMKAHRLLNEAAAVLQKDDEEF